MRRIKQKNSNKSSKKVALLYMYICIYYFENGEREKNLIHGTKTRNECAATVPKQSDKRTNQFSFHYDSCVFHPSLSLSSTCNLFFFISLFPNSPQSPTATTPILFLFLSHNYQNLNYISYFFYS